MKITVVGAGVVGLSCAFELQYEGHEVTVVDAGTAGAAASAGNAGWVTPFLSTPRAAPGAFRDALKSFTNFEGPARMRPHLEVGFASWALRFLRASAKNRSARAKAALQDFSRQAVTHFDSLEERGVEFEQYKDGLAVAFKDEKNLEEYLEVVKLTRSLGYTGDVSIHRDRQVHEFDPALSDQLAGVIHLESERHVRPEDLCSALGKAIINGGGALVEQDPVLELERSTAGTWTTRTQKGRMITTDRVVVAAGFQSRDLLKCLGINVPLEAAKGTSMTARGEGIAPSHPLKLYENMVACSPFGDAVRLSGTFDVGARDDALNRRRLDMVVRQGLTYLQDWRPTEVEVEWVGHRPTSADDLPIIGAVPEQPGLYLATGHGTLGVTLGPLTGALVAREIISGEEKTSLTPFRLARFAA